MSRASGKTQPTTRADALLRLRDAREFHEVGASVRASTPKSAISLFVQAGSPHRTRAAGWRWVSIGAVTRTPVRSS